MTKDSDNISSDPGESMAESEEKASQEQNQLSEVVPPTEASSVTELLPQTEAPPEFPELVTAPLESLPVESSEVQIPSRSVWWHRRRRWVYLALGLAALLTLVLITPPVYLLRSGQISVDQLHKGSIKSLEVGPAVKPWVRLSHLNRFFSYAIISAEDARFYEHYGLDLIEIANSIETNFIHGRYKRGASTITQQVVKICFLGREKTLLRKVREALGALLLEQLLTKDEILEWYVNLVEYGPGVYGITKASQYYFDTRPQYLTLIESIHLALVLPSPSVWSKSLRQRSLTAFGKRRFLTILKNMRLSGYINDSQYQYALSFGEFGRPVAGK